MLPLPPAVVDNASGMTSAFVPLCVENNFIELDSIKFDKKKFTQGSFLL